MRSEQTNLLPFQMHEVCFFHFFLMAYLHRHLGKSKFITRFMFASLLLLKMRQTVYKILPFAVGRVYPSNVLRWTTKEEERQGEDNSQQHSTTAQDRRGLNGQIVSAQDHASCHDAQHG